MLRVASAEELAENPDLRHRLGQIDAEIDGALRELRDLAHGIYPTVLASYGLARALHDLARRIPHVTVSEAAPARFPPEIEAAVYYCCIEAVQNASKHARPDASISIRLHAGASDLRLEVRDNGPGFEVNSAHDGVGLQNMRDRLGAVGARIEILSTPGRGTLIAATVPIGGTRARGSNPGGPRTSPVASRLAQRHSNERTSTPAKTTDLLGRHPPRGRRPIRPALPSSRARRPAGTAAARCRNTITIAAPFVSGRVPVRQ